MQFGALVRIGEREVTLGPGAIIGRMREAALIIDDPRVSEAHALVALRGGGLRLLALRGRLSVNGKPATDVALVPGRKVLLAGYLTIEVVSVDLPDRVVAIAREPLGDERPIPAQGVLAFRGEEGVRQGFDPDAEALVWSGPDGPVLRLGVAPDRPLAVGDAFRVRDRDYRVVVLERKHLESPVTVEKGRFDQALRIVLLYDAVRVHVADRAAAFDGISARAISLLFEVGVPLAWEELARELWPDQPIGPVVRQRWDQLLTRLRAKLRAAGVRSDLVRSSHGLVELVLGAEDTVEDRT